MPPKHVAKKITTFWLLIITVLCYHYSIHAQESKTSASTRNFNSYFADNRIIIKVYYKLEDGKLQIEGGTAKTGIQSIDMLNTEFNVSRINQLFPGSEKL